MSQVTYTELEGFPIRWAYGQAMPLEEEKDADKTAKTWSVDTTPSTQISNENTGTENQVYGSKQVGQVFETGSNALKLTAIQLYGRKNGSPQNPLIIELRKTVLKEYSKPIVEGNQSDDSFKSTQSHGGEVWIAQTYSPTRKIKLIKVEVFLKRYASEEDVIFEIRDVNPDGTPGDNILYTDTIPYSEVGGSASWIPVDVDPPLEIQPGEKYAFIFKLKETPGKFCYYYYYYQSSDIWPNGDGYRSIDQGANWEWIGDIKMRFTVLIDAYIPSDEKLLSLEIDPASFGTSDGWVSKSLSNPIALRPNERYSLVIYTIGGDESNNYILHSGSESLSLKNAMSTSEDSGENWNAVSGQNLSFKLDGVQYQKIYSGSRELPFTQAPASPILVLIIYAQTSSSMEFAGFDDYAMTAPIVTSTAGQQTKIMILSPSDPRLRDPGEISRISWEIWAAGEGLASKAVTQYHALYDRTPVTPRDFGFTELYLIQARGEEDESIAVINDHFAGILYFKNTGDVFQPPSMFRVPIRKIHVLQGKVTFDLLGVE